MSIDGLGAKAAELILPKELRAIMQASLDAVLLLDRDQRVQGFNTAALELFGYRASQLLRRPFIDLLPSRTHADYRLCLVQYPDCPTGHCAPRYIRCVRRDGSEFDAEVSRALDQRESWRHTTIVLRDISARVEALKHNAHRMAVVSTLADAVISIDEQGIIETWNEAAESITGLSAATVMSGSFETWGLFDDCPLTQARLTGVPVRVEGLLNRADGKKLAVSVTSTPMRGPDGAILGVSAIISDITERKKREEHLRFLMMELAHRAKNLMSVIVSMAQCTAENSPSMPEFERKFSARMHSLARSHDLLLKENWAGAKIQDLFERQLSSFADCKSDRVSITGPDIILRPQAAQMLGLAIHELGTNAAKYGALADSHGKLEIGWKAECDADGRQMLVIDWSEHGARPVATPTREGFGFMVISDMVASTLDAEVNVSFEPSGLRWRVEAKPTYWHLAN